MQLKLRFHFSGVKCKLCQDIARSIVVERNYMQNDRTDLSFMEHKYLSWKLDKMEELAWNAQLFLTLPVV